jgi:hypothetical protein
MLLPRQSLVFPNCDIQDDSSTQSGSRVLLQKMLGKLGSEVVPPGTRELDSF